MSQPFHRLLRERQRSKRDPLIEPHPVTYPRRFPDDNPCSVVDEKTLPDLSTWVDVDAGDTVRVFRHDPGDQRHTLCKELMGQPVHGNGKEAGIAEYDLVEALCSWVAFERSPNVLCEEASDAGKLFHEGHRDRLPL